MKGKITMKRIVVGQIMHESSSLAKYPTEEENFRKTTIWYEKDNVWKLSEIGMKDYLTGIMEAGRKEGLDIAPCFCAFANPSGKISEDCFRSLLDHFFDGIDDSKNIDGFCLALHGAGVCETEPDVEGRILEEIRRRYGFGIPVVITLDPHANVTGKMINMADVLLPSKLYPHTDTYETGKKAARMIKGILEGAIRPVMYVKKLRMLIPITKGCTYEEPMRSVIEKCKEAELTNGVLDCSFAQGFPYSNIEECGASVIVTTDNDPELAAEVAGEIASYVSERKRDFISDYPTAEEGVNQAEEILSRGGKLIVINETSDNPGAGTPGDGTFLLKELLKRNIEKSCIGTIVDGEAVKQAVSAGAGATIDVTLGGKTDNLHGEPVAVKGARVKAVCDGKYNILSPMTHNQPVNYGTTVRLISGNVDIVVSTNPFQTMDDGIFTLLGINVKDYNILGVKSAQHFKAYFKELTDHIITVDSPGISTGNLDALPLDNIPRPVFPLDRDACLF